VMPPFPSIPKEDYSPTIISIDTQDAILAEIDWERRGPFLAAACGMRPGEIRALNIDDVYQDENGQFWIRISKAMQGQNAKKAAPRPKTRQHGDAPVSAELLKWISWRFDQVRPEERLRGEIPLFVNPIGRTADRRWLGDALREVWNRAWTRVGVKVRMYEGTKHATATDAIRRGVSERSIQAALRHADRRSTERYARLADTAGVELLRSPAHFQTISKPNSALLSARSLEGFGGSGRESNPPGPCRHNPHRI